MRASKFEKGAFAIIQQPNPTVNHKTGDGEQTESFQTFTFEKEIGGTNYKVCVHFSQSNNETFEDKLLRIIESTVINRE